MFGRKSSADKKVKEVKKWFETAVTHEGEPYVMDLEQVAAVVDESKNTIVVARAGSGKTRTLVAKIIYLVARRGVKPEEIMAFVFNANAAAEINERLSEMLVEGKAVIPEGTRIAQTFHAFSRRIVYDVAGGKKWCGDILADEKEAFVLEVVKRLQRSERWEGKIRAFLGVEEEESGETAEKGENGAEAILEGNNGKKDPKKDEKSDVVRQVNEIANRGGGDVKKPLLPEEIGKFAGMMSQFINRAQQRYLGAEETLPAAIAKYLKNFEEQGREIDERERLFLELGQECYRRYHWYLLGKKSGATEVAGATGMAGSRTEADGAAGMAGATAEVDGAKSAIKNAPVIPRFEGFGTDFNLIVAWAAKIIRSNRGEVRNLLRDKKFLLIDEYQDFSGLFLSAVKAIREVAQEAKLFVVGDDWQAINRFAGSDVDYFKHFEKYFPEETRRLVISTNYRCHYQIVDTARKFMAKAMKEKGNFRAFSKKAGEVILVNPRATPLAYALVDYDDRVNAEDKLYKKICDKMHDKLSKKDTVQYMKTILQIIAENPKAKGIMILHRNNETKLQDISLEKMQAALKWGAGQLKMKDAENFASRVRLMTMHKSKGLESDVVILLEADEGIIPRVHPDTRLYEFFGETAEVVLEDQKRLFYVAMTRAKKKLYIIHVPGKSKKEEGFIRFLGRGVERWREE